MVKNDSVPTGRKFLIYAILSIASFCAALAAWWALGERDKEKKAEKDVVTDQRKGESAPR